MRFQVKRYLRYSTAFSFVIAIVTVGAAGAWAKSGAAAAVVTHFQVVLPTGYATSEPAGSSLLVTITAKSGTGTTSPTATTLNGPVTITDLSGAATVGAVSWSNGVAAVTVTFPHAFVNDQVVVTSGTSTGKSFLVSLYGAPVALHLGVTPMTKVTTATVLTLQVGSKDTLGQRVVNFAGPVTITDLSGHMTVVSPLTWSAAGLGTETVKITQKFKNDDITVAATGQTSSDSGLFTIG